MINTEGLSIYDYCHKRLYHYCKLNGYNMSNTFPVYRANLNQILERFPQPEKAGIIAIQEFASTFQNSNTRKNICIMLRWLFNTVLGLNLNWRELPYPKRTKKVQPVYLEADLMKVFNAINNTKQKAILGLIIDCGSAKRQPIHRNKYKVFL